METSCSCDVKEFSGGGQSAKTDADDPEDDSQQGPEHVDARPRADSSAIGRFNVADLEPTTDELERERKGA